jgi:hypothetical protein
LDASGKYGTAKNLQEHCGTPPEQKTFFAQETSMGS